MHTKDTKTPQALRGLALGVALLGLAGCFPPSALEMDLRQFGAQQHRPAGGEPPGRLQPEAGGGAVAPCRGRRDGEIRQNL